MALPLSLLVGGLVIELVGLGLSQNATNHMLDAVNIYNDDAER